MTVIIAAAQHVLGARCADNLGALPHTLLSACALKRSDDVVGL